MFRNTGRGKHVRGVREAWPACTASERRKPSRRSHYKVNRLPFSGTAVAKEAGFNFPFQWTGLV